VGRRERRAGKKRDFLYLGSKKNNRKRQRAEGIELDVLIRRADLTWEENG